MDSYASRLFGARDELKTLARKPCKSRSGPGNRMMDGSANKLYRNGCTSSNVSGPPRLSKRTPTLYSSSSKSSPRPSLPTASTPPIRSPPPRLPAAAAFEDPRANNSNHHFHTSRTPRPLSHRPLSRYHSSLSLSRRPRRRRRPIPRRRAPGRRPPSPRRPRARARPRSHLALVDARVPPLPLAKLRMTIASKRTEAFPRVDRRSTPSRARARRRDLAFERVSRAAGGPKSTPLPTSSDVSGHRSSTEARRGGRAAGSRASRRATTESRAGVRAGTTARGGDVAGAVDRDRVPPIGGS